MLGRREDPHELLVLFEEAGRNAHRAALLIRDMVGGFPERAGLAGDILLCEQEGDRIAHDILHRVAERDGRGLLGSADAHALTSALDDIVDHAEEAADRLVLYGVEAPMEQAQTMTTVLVGASEQVAQALHGLRVNGDVARNLVAIRRLEHEGDRIVRSAIASLFVDGTDPMIVIRWKDIFESLEQAVDACATVAHVLEGIGLKRGRREPAG